MSRTGPGAPAARPGRREQKKQEKLERIRDAAEALFAEKGFEGTTLRELAERADVATGTLFLYVADKRELLFLVLRDRLSRTVERSLRDMPGPQAPLVDRLMFCFGRLFALYAKDAELARHFIKEQLFASGGRWEAEMHALTRAFTGQLAQIVAEAQAAGEIDPALDLAQVATNVFALYFAVLVGWLSGRVDVAGAQHALRAALELQCRGLGAATPPARAGAERRGASRRSAR